jgi:hypothetical protein
MTDVDTLSAEAILGDDADKFLRSDLGKVVIGLAIQEAEEAKEEFKTVNPENSARIRELQNIIWRAESFEGWLRGLVVEGEQALQSLQHDEEAR